MHESFDKPVDLLSPDKTKKHKWWLIVISLLAGLFLLALFFFNRVAPQKYGVTLHPKTSIFQTVKNIIFNEEMVLEGQKDDRVNILLLGMGGAGHDGPYLTDTNIIISIKPSTNEVAMVSIPRDLGVSIGEYGVRKINHANSFGELEQSGNGGEYARKVFEQTFGITIPYYVRVDFKAFTELIDQVGGVQVEVPRTFTDTQFPGPNFSYQTIHFDAGIQTLKGEQALNFARSRHGNNNEGSDFARAHRQQLVITALKEKLLSAGTYTNPATVQQMLNSFSNHVTTNMNLGQLMYLATLAKEINGRPRNLVLDNSNGGFLVSTTGETGAFLLFPRTGDYGAIQMAIRDIFEAALPTSTTAVAVKTTPSTAVVTPTYQPPVAKTSSTTRFPSLKIEVQNGTWRAGLAARLKEGLQEKGFSVITVGNSLKKPIDKTAIYLLNSASSMDAAKALSSELKAPLLTVIPEWLKPGYNNPETTEDESGMKYNVDADVLVILGTDTP